MIMGLIAAWGSHPLYGQNTPGLTHCPHTGRFVVTRDSIGPFPVAASVGQLLAICPYGHLDTLYASEGAHGPTILAFAFDSVQLRGMVTRNRFPIRFGAADTVTQWTIRGHGSLADGTSFVMPWASLRTRVDSGPIQMVLGTAFVRFAKWPKWEFIFNHTGARKTGQFTLQQVSQWIPDTASADNVRVLVP
jgi:hypothetical protein